MTPGYFPMHDDIQVVRVQQMHKQLTSWQFPVRWVADLGYGYGYPIFNFYNPLPYYFGAAAMFAGLDALAATKAMMVFPIVASAASMYVLARMKLNRLGAMLAGLLYLYAPYHAVQIYVRGAVAEYWAYAVLPLVFWALWKGKVAAGGMFLAILILSHNLTAVMVIPFLGLVVVSRFIGTKKTEIINYSGNVAAIFAIGLGLSAFFWLPATIEASQTGVADMVFHQFDPPARHLISAAQLWSSPWGYGGSSAGLDDGLSMQLGKVYLAGSILAIAISLRRLQDKAVAFFTIGLLFSLFMLLTISAPVWDAFSLLSYIQFPWRYLTYASLFSSILAALAFSRLARPLILIGCFLLVVYSVKFFQPQYKYETSAADLTSVPQIIWEKSRVSDEYLPKGFIRPGTLEEALRVDNPRNATLVDRMKVNTPLKKTSNLISLVSVISVITVVSLRSLKPETIIKSY